LLVQLGVWERFLASDPRPVHAIWSAWGEDRLVSKDFVAGPFGPAWCVDRPRFDEVLRERAAEAGARVVLSAGRIAIEGSRVTWSGGSAEGRLLIDATGRTARIARGRGARWLAHDRAVALIAVLEPRAGVEVAGEDVLLIESAAAGWWYSCVLPGGALAAAHVTDVEVLRAEPRPPAEYWSGALAETEFTALRAAGFTPRSFFVRLAGTGRLDRAYGPGWLAAGDAACAVDPLSGGGVTKALQSAIAAAGAAENFLAGDPRALERHAGGVREEYLAYLRTGREYYRLERRWPESRFWQLRQRAIRGEGDSSWPTENLPPGTLST
jgi:flavin-dependent dehydrogenase